MRWQTGDGSNVEDLRGRRVIGVGSLGVGGLLLVAALSYFTGTDFSAILGIGNSTAPAGDRAAEVATSPEEERRVQFVDAVARDTQSTWTRLLGSRYQPTVVVLFRDAVESACGTAESATGPFYCPQDHKVYLDLAFFQELSQRFGAPGDFAQAYVVAHEFGHHVQNLVGHQRVDLRSGANSTSVALELQADCYAGIWGHDAAQQGRFSAGKVELEPGDADEALKAASAIGDDRLQRMATGHVAPEQFTHGTSAQRMEWFQRGMKSGDPAQCNTFAQR